jgi:hypothetical protein
MKLHFGHICVFVTLTLAACVPASAYVFPVDSNDQSEDGGYGSPTYSSAGASAGGSTPYSSGWGTGSHNLYTTEELQGYCSSYVSVHAHGFADWVEGSRPFGGGFAGASSDTLSLSANAPCSPLYYGGWYTDDDGGYPEGRHGYRPVHLFAWECVSSGNGAGAEASAEGRNEGSGWGVAQTSLSLE